MREYSKAITFSYDDGIRQDRKLVDLFRRYHLGATFNLNTGIQTEESHFIIGNQEIYRMNQEEIGNLYDGFEIAVHGLTHTVSDVEDEEVIAKEFGTDIENITRLYGKRPVGMAYPYGNHDGKQAQWLLDHGIKYGRTVEATGDFSLPQNPILLKATCHHKDERLFELAEKFLKEEPKPGEKWLFYVWGHSYEFDVDDNWDRMEKFCQLISGKEDIYYGSNEQCLRLFGCID